MTRTWVDDRTPFPKDRRWVMRCDESGCTTKSEPSVKQPALQLFIDAGWHIAANFGDVCPKCLAAGVTPTSAPHPAMAAEVTK